VIRSERNKIGKESESEKMQEGRKEGRKIRCRKEGRQDRKGIRRRYDRERTKKGIRQGRK
jgi:hypothetical protein